MEEKRTINDNFKVAASRGVNNLSSNNKPRPNSKLFNISPSPIQEENEGGRTRKFSINDEPLHNKMPNFVKHYDDLYEHMISINFKEEGSKTPTVKKMPMINTDSINLDAKRVSDVSELVSSIKPKALTPNKTKLIEDKSVLLQSMTNTEDIKDFYEYTESCLNRISKLKVVSEKEIEHMMINLPFEEEIKRGKKLAIFDLDETLVHCETKKPQRGHVQLKLNLTDGSLGLVSFIFNH
jgi:hypothetical protein